MMMSSWKIVVMLLTTLVSSGFCQDCSSDPCLENAPCVNATLGYYCQCPVVPVSTSAETVYSGQNCDESYIGSAGCNMNYYDSEGNITSPGYPNVYQVRQDCYSHLKIADATQITLILEEFNLEPQVKDILIFGKGPAIYEVDPMQPDIYELGGERASLPLSERTYVFNDTNQIFFYFYSNKNVVHPGYRISYTADINECLSNPCKNGGTCTDETNMYTCTCEAGYTGDECQTNINECMSAPCQNGGVCVDGVNSYFCLCTGTGFDGTHCENKIDECSSNPCENEGTCTDLIAMYTCTCAAGFEGNECQTNINECMSAPCENSGTCVDGINNYVCICTDTGFDGTNCDNNIDDCANNPCENGGTCTDGINDYSCTCEPGYIGDDCEINFNECGSTPCQNNGTCMDGINSYSCDCMDGWTGPLCGDNIDECASNPCSNGGTCDDGINELRFSAMRSWGVDTYCELDITCALPMCAKTLL
eukprot:XP_011684261.1 PREDICTED: fibropellin-1-like [Strongylocentrotus purpuratus]